MIGDSAVSVVIDKVFLTITNVFSAIINGALSAIFINGFVALIIWFIFMNFIAVILMKKDKEYAKNPEARRIKESTLLMVALFGGAYGEYYAMYKYKHKTLHKNFLYMVPISMMIHFALISYSALIGILA